MHQQRCSCDVDPLCIDCKVDTNEIEEFYMVTDEVWELAIPDPDQRCGQLCIGCIEQRLGRPLNAHDFTEASVNEELQYSERLRDRLLALPRAEFEAQKEKFLAHLRVMPDRDTPSIGCEHHAEHRSSINELIREVELETDKGRDYVRLSAIADRRIAAAKARRPWNRIKKFFSRFRIPPEDLHVKP